MEGIQCTGICVSIVVPKLFVPGIVFRVIKYCGFPGRDIKGANILVDPNGEIKLADFGMAKHVHLSYPINRSLLLEYLGYF